MRSLRRVLVACALACIAVACGSSSDGGSQSNPTTGGDASAGADAMSSDAHSSGDSAMGDSSASDSSASDSASSNDSGVDSAADSSGDSPSPIPDGSIPDVAVFDGGMCNALVNAGPQVTLVNVPQDPPAGKGGTIALGLYYLTKWEAYTGQGGASGATTSIRKTAFVFSSSTQYLKVTRDVDLGQPDENDNRTYSTQDTTLNSVQSCPTVDNLSSDYTATLTTLVLIGGNEVHTFTLQ
jgi:hypothetical protein